MIYSHFESTLVQTATAKRILPFKAPDHIASTAHGKISFEPNKDEILHDLIPRVLEIKIWQAILESVASEHSARMVAMQNATDAAKDMISDLTLVFNKARQSSITAELADISGGRAALE